MLGNFFGYIDDKGKVRVARFAERRGHTDGKGIQLFHHGKIGGGR